MSNPFLQWGVWIASACLETFLFIQLVRFRQLRTYPFFCLYVCWHALRNIPSMMLFHFFPKSYYKAFWFFETVDWALTFFFILEAYHHVLDRYAGLRKLSDVLVVWFGVGLISVVAASIMFVQAVDAQPTQWINNWLYLMRRSVRLVHSGFLVSLVLLFAIAGLRISFLLRYLVLGLLVNSVAQFAVAALRFQLGPAVYSVVSVASSVSYLCILMVWCWAVQHNSGRVEQPQPAELPRPDQQWVLARLEGINASLTSAFHQ